MNKLICVIPKSDQDEIRVLLNEYHGHQLVTARIFRKLSKGKSKMPTRKGLSVQIQFLPELTEALNLALDVAKKNQLLGPGRARNLRVGRI